MGPTRSGTALKARWMYVSVGEGGREDRVNCGVAKLHRRFARNCAKIWALRFVHEFGRVGPYVTVHY